MTINKEQAVSDAIARQKWHFTCRIGLHWWEDLPKGETRQFKRCRRCHSLGVAEWGA